jgi:uncharacterized membrane protein
MYPESNRNFETNRLLGGVGALLTAIGSLVLFHGTVGIVGLVGLILLLLSMRGLADDFQNYSIFRNVLTGFVFGIIGTVLAIIVFAAFTFLSGFIFSHYIVGALGFIVAIVGWLLMFVFLLLSGIFYRQAFASLAYKSHEQLLRTGGLLLLIGSILTIIFVGFFVMFIAWLIIAVGLFSLRPPMQPAQVYTPPPPPPTSSASSGQTRYCQQCGAENTINGTFCTRCGQRLSQP